jgi:transposase
MIAVPAWVRIVVASRPVDFRNGLDGLAALVQQALRENPFAGDLFVFRAKRADRVQDPGLGWHGFVPVPQASGRRAVLSGRRCRMGRFA